MTRAMTERVEVRRAAFEDPLTLLEASERARALDRVTHVAVGMATGLNLVIITGRFGYEFDAGGAGLTPDDVLIAVRAEDDGAAAAAIAEVDAHLTEHRGERRVRDVGPFTFMGEPRNRVATPATGGAGDAIADALDRRRADAARIAAANDEAVRRMQDARPFLVGAGPAADLMPDMGSTTFFHAGPPIGWEDMSGPMRGAIVGAALFEGVAEDPDDAVRRAEVGDFEFIPGHERAALGPMAGVVSPSMPMWIVENANGGNRAHCSFSEGLGEMLRFGAYGPVVVERLRWMRSVMLPVMQQALAALDGPLDLRDLCAQALEMGDECHNRNRAGTSLFMRTLASALVRIEAPSQDVAAVADFVALSDYTFLNLSMPAAKVMADAASAVEGSTIVTTMARNGTEFGIRTSGTGDRWFTGPSQQIDGCYLPGYQPDVANPDLGDSAITETVGLGGFALAGAPALGHYIGTSAEDAVRATLTMYDITWAESDHFRIPALGFRGTPVGIDVRKVVETGVLPLIDTGIAHREAGVGVIGGGIVRPPLDPFVTAIRALAG
jgi:Protein of unknown function (DUF1116)